MKTKTILSLVFAFTFIPFLLLAQTTEEIDSCLEGYSKVNFQWSPADTNRTKGFYMCIVNPALIKGNVSEDTDNDSLGDKPISNVKLFLLDASGKEVLDDNNNKITTTTDDAGNYSFPFVPAGEYQILQEQPAHFVSLSDGDTTDDDDVQANSDLRDNIIPVTAKVGETDADNNFVEVIPAIITGNVFEDNIQDDVVDGNAIGNPDDGILYVNLIDVESGFIIETAQVSTDGTYTFTNIIPGSYKLQMTINEGEIGQEAPETKLPPRWYYVGDANGNGRVTGAIDGILSVTVNSGINTEGIDYGISKNPLPVEFLTFDSAIINDNVVLSWATALELNNDKFEVERSYDGEIYETIGVVSGNDTTSETSHYKFVDRNAAKGVITYYKLKQIDFNGLFNYSDIISVNAPLSSIQIYPNPVTDYVYLDNAPDNCQYKIYSGLGEVVKEGDLHHVIDVSFLSQGYYILVVTSNDKNISKTPFVKG